GIYTRECERPNEIWQADHTMLDIEVLNEKNEIGRPWLTIVLDDYSRAIAGFRIEFGTPDTERTALVLRQAIWKKGNSNWPICGIPEKRNDIIQNRHTKRQRKNRTLFSNS